MLKPAVPESDSKLTCRLCGQIHRRIRLAPGESALCGRCGFALEQRGRLGSDAAPAFAVTGLILAVPAALLPFASAEKLGDARVGFLFTGLRFLWTNGMPLLAVPVFLFGFLLPICLLSLLVILLLSDRLGFSPRVASALGRTAGAVAHWAMPEVQVLAVLVAFVKLGSVVNLTIGPGFWCYAAMAVSLLVAWRSFDLAPSMPAAAAKPCL
jgi:paraquat-inducible protein A